MPLGSSGGKLLTRDGGIVDCCCDPAESTSGSTSGSFPGGCTFELPDIVELTEGVTAACGTLVPDTETTKAMDIATCEAALIGCCECAIAQWTFGVQAEDCTDPGWSFLYLHTQLCFRTDGTFDLHWQLSEDGGPVASGVANATATTLSPLLVSFTVLGANYCPDCAGGTDSVTFSFTLSEG